MPFLVGGAYAFARYTGIERHTKDFDVFIRREDFRTAKKVFESAGYKIGADVSALARQGVQRRRLHRSDLQRRQRRGGGRRAAGSSTPSTASVFDVDVKLIPAEEMIWSKGLIMERERFDGADVAHVIHAVGDRSSTGAGSSIATRIYWRALYAHLVLFGFIYPSERSQVPAWVMDELAQRVARRDAAAGNAQEKICYGTIISRQQYLTRHQRVGLQGRAPAAARQHDRGGDRALDRGHRQWTERSDDRTRHSAHRRGRRHPRQEDVAGCVAAAVRRRPRRRRTSCCSAAISPTTARSRKRRSWRRSITASLRIPAIGVLGNHDFESGKEEEIVQDPRRRRRDDARRRLARDRTASASPA